MPPRKRGLAEDEVQALRQQVDAGKRPRVRLSGPHFGDDATGTVLRVGTPEADGADFLRVRVKINGMTDELAFAPAELQLGSPAKAGSRTNTPRKRAANKTGAAKAAAGLDAAPGAPELAGSAQPDTGSGASSGTAATAADQDTAAAPTPADSTAAGRAPRTSRARVARSAPSARSDAQKPAAAAQKPAAQNGPAANGETARVANGDAARRPAGGRRRKPAAAASVSFTVSSDGTAWALDAVCGTKVLARKIALNPGAVTELVTLLDQPALTGAVAEINDAVLAEAQARAAELRAELDRLEAVLATHRRS